MIVPDNTQIECVVCNDYYDIIYTEKYNDIGDRVCFDCIEGRSLQ